MIAASNFFGEQGAYQHEMKRELFCAFTLERKIAGHPYMISNTKKPRRTRQRGLDITCNAMQARQHCWAALDASTMLLTLQP
ncbi:hypothetical protein HMPREF1248_0937 [Coriobacteriaceae bacterium BV3Ac1]|nr:hypothetical protein HMPREF1248_0937 [Coriobacteriaceae bacterium BV3Ac1]